MASLTPRDKRTLRFGAIAVALYLTLFYGMSGLNRLEALRNDYDQRVAKAQSAVLERQRHENKILLLEKLKSGSFLNIEGLSRAAIVSQASEAIQKAAQGGGVKLGPIRESRGSSSSRELASMQLEATGPVTGVMTLLHRLDTLAFPLVIESLQIDPEKNKPGTVKIILHVVLLDYERWKTEERDRV